MVTVAAAPVRSRPIRTTSQMTVPTSAMDIRMTATRWVKCDVCFLAMVRLAFGGDLPRRLDTRHNNPKFYGICMPGAGTALAEKCVAVAPRHAA